MNMELFCYQAECGDAIRIRYIGNDSKPHNIFLDSGFERTYRNLLRQEINILIQAGENIDLWVISHIHEDHIGGAIKFIKSIENREIQDVVEQWYYNPPRNYPFITDSKVNRISSPSSITQGDQLYNYLYKNNKLPKQDITTDLEVPDFFGMQIHILSPTTSVMTELRNKYRSVIPFEKNEIDTISFATSAAEFDYHKKNEDFDLNEFTEDTSLENRSSISLLLEYQDKKILWLADSHPSVVVESLAQKGYSIKQPLICDYVILSHHASKGNNSSSLFNMIKCKKYIISSDGENKHRLPNKEVLSKILRNRNRDLSVPYSLYFTYDTPNLNKIFGSDGSAIFDTWNFKIVHSTKSLHLA